MNKVVEFIENYHKSNPTGWRKWVIGSVVVFATLFVIGMIAYANADRLRQIASLTHERDKLKEEARKAEVDKKLASNKEERIALTARAEDALDRAHDLEVEIKALETNHDENQAIIDSIRSWSDVDRKVR